MRRQKHRERHALHGAEQQAANLATRLGLYLLVERRPTRWVLYDRHSGTELIAFYPQSSLAYRPGQAPRRVRRWRSAIELAVAHRERKEVQHP